MKICTTLYRDNMVYAATGLVALTGLYEPEDGENPDFTVTAPEGVTVDSVDWQKSGQMLDASDTFTGGETYTARIFLSANPGYKFAVDGADTAVWATINGRTSGINKYDSYELSDKICVALGFLAPTEMSTIKKAVAVTKAQGKVTYKTDNKKVSVRKGTITVAKGLKKGKTYKVKVTVTAKGNSNYSSRKIVKTIKIKVK